MVLVAPGASLGGARPKANFTDTDGSLWIAKFPVRDDDRAAGSRRFYASAMALLRKDHSEGISYLELAEVLHHRGAKDFIAADLEQLFRRVVFNVAVGNRDDHLCNHGFLLTPTGWRLAPAFDVNPNPDKAEHVLNIDEKDNRPSLGTAIDTSEWYLPSKDRGAAIVAEIIAVTRCWREAATHAGIARADIELTAAAFAVSDTGL